MEPTTQDKIVTAARQLFGEKGFRGATTADIARAAGIAEGTIFRYFKDKKELLMACVSPVIREAVLRESQPPPEAATPRDVLKHRILERMRVIREHQDVFNILFTEGSRVPEIARLLLDLVAGTLSAEQVESAHRATQAGILKRPINPLIMSVGVTSAIWAMYAVGPESDQIFAQWPFPFRYADLEVDFANFICDALLGEVANDA